jgi:hypothetical protein
LQLRVSYQFTNQTWLFYLKKHNLLVEWIQFTLPSKHVQKCPLFVLVNVYVWLIPRQLSQWAV